MDDLKIHRDKINADGFTVIDDVYSSDDIESIIQTIQSADHSAPSFRKTNDLFAIRQFLKQVPEVKPIIFNAKLNEVICDLFGDDYFVVKSIYFDKPEHSNWFVAWHQDLTISVDKKVEISGYGPWTVKGSQFAVQPPLSILKNNFTIRIHLDDTDEHNGALKVITASHLKDIYRVENINWDVETEAHCSIKAGGIMIMRPLLMHASDRTVNHRKRRVLHIEFSNSSLPEAIGWAEKSIISHPLSVSHRQP